MSELRNFPAERALQAQTLSPFARPFTETIGLSMLEMPYRRRELNSQRSSNTDFEAHFAIKGTDTAGPLILYKNEQGEAKQHHVLDTTLCCPSSSKSQDADLD